MREPVLERLLRWIVLQFAFPAFSGAWHRDAPRARRFWRLELAEPEGRRGEMTSLGGFGETRARLTVGQLQQALAEFPDDLPVAAIWGGGTAGGRVCAVQTGLDPDENCPAILLVVD